MVRGLVVTAARSVSSHTWQFKRHFRRNAFGWRSQPAVKRVKEAVTEIKRVAKTDPMLAAHGAVLLLERISPALAHVDSSSGAIGSAVNRAIHELVPILASPNANPETRDDWLERLFQAHADDEIPYIETLSEHWGRLCASANVASRWADRLLPITRQALTSDKTMRGHFHGTTMCLSALLTAGRNDELIELLEHETFWPYKRYAVIAMAALGRGGEAIELAESLRGPWTSNVDVHQVCEQILLDLGETGSGFVRYAAGASEAATYIGWFRNIERKYPQKKPAEILSMLVAHCPGDEGKWFAAAKDSGLYDEALALVRRSPCDPKTLARAARDFADTRPAFAMEVGVIALDWLAQGYGYEVTSADVIMAHGAAVRAADRLGKRSELDACVQQLAGKYMLGENIVAHVLRVRL